MSKWTKLTVKCTSIFNHVIELKLLIKIIKILKLKQIKILEHFVNCIISLHLFDRFEISCYENKLAYVLINSCHDILKEKNFRMKYL